MKTKSFRPKDKKCVHDVATTACDRMETFAEIEHVRFHCGDSYLQGTSQRHLQDQWRLKSPTVGLLLIAPVRHTYINLKHASLCMFDVNVCMLILQHVSPAPVQHSGSNAVNKFPFLGRGLHSSLQ